jgi:hypothetical protein
MPDTQKKHLEIPLTGKLMLSDPATIGTNFQTLTNMRYTDSNIQSIAGNAKINTSALETYLKVRNAHQFTKSLHTENHVLAQAYNTGLTASQIIENTTAIPSAGAFSATSLWTDSAGAGRGYFSPAPNGQVVYANGVDTCIWGGNEMASGAFIVSTAVIADDGTATNPRDYSQVMRNTKTDSENVALIGGGVDSYTKLMIHFEGDDAATADITATTGQTVSLEGNACLDIAQKKFGVSSIYFDGTGDYATVPDHADWNFGTGDFTIEFWLKEQDITDENGYFGQYVDANNYWGLKKLTGYNEIVNFTVVVGASALISENFFINGSTAWQHIELCRTGNYFKFFLNGNSYTTINITGVTMPDFAGVLEIGAFKNHSSVLKGWIDEFRISKGIARHTASFTPPVKPYAANGSYVLVGSPRPLKGIKPYVNVANQTTSTLTGYVWNGSTWQTLTLTDNTVTTGVSLAKTGTVTFDTTVGTAKPKYIEGYFLYWYQFYLSAGDCELYHVTLDAPFQAITDLWDGMFRDVSAAYKRTTSLKDITLNILRDDYDVDTPDTYGDLTSMAAFSDPANALEIGFSEKQCGLHFRLPPEYTNSTAATVMAIDYWNGTEYLSVGEVSDGTSDSGISLAKSGTVTWNNSSLADETRHNQMQTTVVAATKTVSIGSGLWGSALTKLFNRVSTWFEERKARRIPTDNTIQFSAEPLYFYRVRFDQAMDANVRLNYVGGISSQQNVSYFKFPIMAQNRLLLCCDMAGDKNRAVVSAKYMPQVYNGVDSVDIYFGEEGELTCGTELYSQYGGNLYSLILIFKNTESWIVAGQDISQWENNVFPLSTTIGCPAPLTLKTVNLAVEPGAGINRSLAIWQGSSGIYMSDGRAPIPIHNDIKEYFDMNDARCITLSKIGDSVGFVDSSKQEYHWLFANASSTTLNKELVYDIKRNKWFEIDRGTGMDLQCGLNVEDTYGNQYTYGFIDTGYMERLEYGNTFDGNNIVSTFQFGDFAPLGLSFESQLDHLKLVSVIPATATDDVTCTHYADTATSGTDYTMDVSTTGYRVSKPAFDSKLQGTYHSLKFTKTTDDEASGFKPIAVVATFHQLAED